MPLRYKKINDVLSRVRQARNVVTALRLAGQAEGADTGQLYWPDLITAVESILPTTDEMSEAMADIHRAEFTKHGHH